MENVLGTVYILKASQPIGNADKPKGRAQFYVGWADMLERRLREHRQGKASKITAAMVAAGAQLEVVYSQPGTRSDERAIKEYRNTPLWLERHLRKQARALQKDEVHGDRILGVSNAYVVEADWRHQYTYSLLVHTRSGRTLRAELETRSHLETLGFYFPDGLTPGRYTLPETIAVTVVPDTSTPAQLFHLHRYQARFLRRMDTAYFVGLKAMDVLCLNGQRWQFDRFVRPAGDGWAVVSLLPFNGNPYSPTGEPAEFTLPTDETFTVERMSDAARRSGRGWAVRK